jgi:hypothetical protein
MSHALGWGRKYKNPGREVENTIFVGCLNEECSEYVV